jgi:hypothetical protein
LGSLARQRLRNAKCHLTQRVLAPEDIENEANILLHAIVELDTPN